MFIKILCMKVCEFVKVFICLLITSRVLMCVSNTRELVRLEWVGTLFLLWGLEIRDRG